MTLQGLVDLHQHSNINHVGGVGGGRGLCNPVYQNSPRMAVLCFRYFLRVSGCDAASTGRSDREEVLWGVMRVCGGA